MSNKKIIRDPVYGYIEINADILHGVVDTATFQRLRNVRQTSYDPLYPAAAHTRFSHSLGVYYLGTFAAGALKRSFENMLKENTEYWGPLEECFGRYQELFELACLLHDVGHSPFSHTGEKFYKSSRSDVEILADKDRYDRQILVARSEEEKKKIEADYEEERHYTYLKHLAQLTKDPVFKSPSAESPAPHEIMSCIVALEAFGTLFYNSDEKSFFSRCITGLQYEEVIKGKPPEEYTLQEQITIRDRSLRNCFIQLLHSSIIDVDRLDYIMRDAATAGYQSVSIDYIRLLKGVSLIRTSDYSDVFSIGFHKSATSIIENAVYAHDVEKKWVQGHPAILYDSFLLDRAIKSMEEEIQKEKSTLFSFDSLTGGGSRFGGGISVRYLCDADLLYLMKNVFWNQYSEEYFKRDTRPVPVWKSESEFKAYFTKEERKKLGEAMRLMGVFTSEGNVELDDGELGKRISAWEANPQNYASQRRKELTEKILELCDKNGLRRKIVILSASVFMSNFYKNKDEVKKIPILFPDIKRVCPLKEVATTLSSDEPEEEKLYYLYYYPKEGREKIDTARFSKDLVGIIQDNKLRT